MDVLNDILESPMVQLILYGLLVLVILVMVDLILGILAAIKQGKFEWPRVGEFYRTKVIPELGGWLLFVLAARAGFNTIVDPTADAYNAIYTGAAGIAWGIVVKDLFYSIGENFCTIFGVKLPVKKDPAA
jgi:hypothetical protein